MDEPLQEPGPRWRRRKQARPAEITAAATEVFSEHGFAAAKLDDIARRAGVAKGSIYLYFSTKEDLFRAVVRATVVPNTQSVRAAAEAFEGPLAELVPRLLAGAAGVLSRPDLVGIARMVIGEARNFPDIARIWHDEVVAPMIDTMARLIARAQARGEIVAGAPRLYAFSLVGPLLAGALFRDVFAEAAPDAPDLQALAEQHGRTLLRGLLAAPSPP